MLKISKSPFNYIGNKYRIMEELRQHFPKNINVFVDLFCGGCDATINVEAKIKYANDINHHVVDIYKTFQRDIDSVIPYVEETIKKWELSKTNEQGYKDFREYYNKTRLPMDLYVLMCHSFNYQFRFNSSHEYNNPFGKNRSHFSSVMKKNLEIFLPRIQAVKFSSIDFGMFDLGFLGKEDFVYCDPPYLLTCGSYNDGKRGFNGWNASDDSRLFLILDGLNQRGVKFALSNVVEHKGQVYDALLNWVNKNKYVMHDINCNYNNCNYQANNRKNITREILITNY